MKQFFRPFFGTICRVLTFGSVVFLFCGCYVNQQVAQCIENDECLSGLCLDGKCVDTDSQNGGESDDDTTSEIVTDYPEPLTGVDILFVVDDSASMLHEQNKMGGAVRTLLLELTERLVGGLSLDLAAIDARFAVITPDMGLSYGDDSIYSASNVDDSCVSPIEGDDGVMRTEISDEYNWDPENPCPDVAPFIEDDMFLALNDNNLYADFRDAMTCMMPTGLHGCVIGQPLRATYAAFTKHGQTAFLRKNALTVIIAVSDADDCSVEEPIWFEIFDESSPIKEFCGVSEPSMYTPHDLYELLLQAKTDATGVEAEGSMMFAAVVGVPNVPDCQGRGDLITDCRYASLPGGGTMENPYIDGDSSSASVSYACEEWDGEGDALTQAYPAMRMVQVAQEFGQLGYVSSICNESWNYAMSEIADIIDARLED